MIAYIKKFIFVGILFTVVIFITSWLVPIVGNPAGLIWNNENFRYLVTMLVAIALVLPVVKHLKISSKGKKAIYKKERETHRSRLLIALKSQDFRQEVIVFSVYLIPFLIISAMQVEVTSFLAGAFAGVFTLSIFVSLFGLLSLLMQLWVYRTWDNT